MGKANVLNRQYSSVFTPSSPQPGISKMRHISVKPGVKKLLSSFIVDWYQTNGSQRWSHQYTRRETNTTLQTTDQRHWFLSAASAGTHRAKTFLCHLESNKIRIENQDGFRHSHSCETRLLMFVDELLRSMSKGKQIDDFPKAFDMGPHNSLCVKRSGYSIQDKTLD